MTPSIRVAEIDREGPSYTVDTLRALAEIPEYADAELFFVTGADAWPVCQPGGGTPNSLDRATFVESRALGMNFDVGTASRRGRIKLVTIPEVDISSTLIRRRLADGQQIDGLTTPEVISASASVGCTRNRLMSRRLLVAIGILVLFLVLVVLAVVLRSSATPEPDPVPSPTSSAPVTPTQNTMLVAVRG